MLFKTLGPVPTFRHIRFCGSNGWGLQGSPIEILKGVIFDPLLLLITSKDNPRQLTRKRKKMSSLNTMNNIKITDVFRRQPPTKKIPERIIQNWRQAQMPWEYVELCKRSQRRESILRGG